MKVGNYLRRGSKEDRPRLFSLVFCDRTRGDGHKLKYTKKRV